MSEETPTRTDTVEANIAAVINKHGDEAWDQIASVCLQDISVSLAMLVDAGSSNEEAT